MDAQLRIEQALDAALRLGESAAAPPRLQAATRHAVFPGGARIRPRLCLAVAWACGDDRPPLADAAAVSIELLHCASLVHDDLPCFDDAAMRRGQASVHAAYRRALGGVGRRRADRARISRTRPRPAVTLRTASGVC
jgi:geranylgeranyl diphosphate synthase type II